jgi:diacylglycerol kinase family enzyme
MITGRGARGRGALHLHDLAEFTLRADRPMPVEVDGDYLGEREALHVRSVPAALRVYC